MKLMASELMKHLERGDVLLGGGDIADFPSEEATQIRHVLMSMIHASKKYIFDNGCDEDPDIISATNEKAEEMIDDGSFRLPHPLIMIEDVVHDGDSDDRLFYICEEVENGDKIQVLYVDGIDGRFLLDAIQFEDEQLRDLVEMVKDQPRYDIWASTATIDLKAKKITAEIAERDSSIFGDDELQRLAEACYAVKKFIVMLHTGNVTIEPVARRSGMASLPKRLRERNYGYEIVRCVE